MHFRCIKGPPQNLGHGIDSVGPPHPGGLFQPSQRPQTPLRRLKTPPNGPQMPQEASKTPSDGSKTPQEASKRPPRPSKIDFSSQHGLLKPQKTIKIYWKNNDSEPLHEFNIRSLLYQTLMPTWLHFGVKFPPRRLLDAFKTP